MDCVIPTLHPQKAFYQGVSSPSYLDTKEEGKLYQLDRRSSTCAVAVLVIDPPKADLYALRHPGDSVLLSFASCGACGPCDSAGRYACESWGMLNFGRVRSDGTGFVGNLKDGRRVNGSYFGQSSFGKHALVRGSSVRNMNGSRGIKRQLTCATVCKGRSVFGYSHARPTWLWHADRRW